MLSKVFKQDALRGVRQIRRVYHLWRLRLVLRRNHHPTRDQRINRDNESGWLKPSTSSRPFYGSLALMPSIIPKHERWCNQGHRMFFRTVPLLGLESMIVLGCMGANCPSAALNQIKQIAAEYGITEVQDGSNTMS